MLWAVWAVVWAAAASALPYHDIDSSKVSIDSLSIEELDYEFQTRLEALQAYIERKYEEHLSEHQINLQRLSRSRRHVTVSSAHPSQHVTAAVPSLAPGYWHSYTYNTIVEREMLTVKSVSEVGSLGTHEITQVFPLGLDNLPAICRSGVGRGLVAHAGELIAVQVHSPWTRTRSGCPCDVDKSMNCACCYPGGCLCEQSAGHLGDTCVQCGNETALVACQTASWHPLELNAAVGLQYQLDNDAKVLQQVLITEKDNTIHFFKLDSEGVQPMTSLVRGQKATHLGYGEVMVNFLGTLKTSRFLIMFDASQHKQEYREISVSPTENTISVGLAQSWHAHGSAMKTWSAGGRLVVGVLQETNLLLHELKDDPWHQFHMRLIQTVTSSEDIISWTTFGWGLEHFLLVVTTSLAKLYLLRGAHYEVLQDIFPSGDLQEFKTFFPLHVPSCRDEVILLTGEDTRLVAYVWNGTARAMQVGYTRTLDASVPTWKHCYQIKGSGDEPVQVVVHGRDGVIILEVEALLSPLLDPVILQNEVVYNAMKDLEIKHQQQTSVIAAAKATIENNVDCGNATNGTGPIVISGPVTLINGIDVIGAFNTSQLEAQTMGLHGTQMDGISYYYYRDQLVSLTQYSKMMDQLSVQLATIGSKLEDAVPSSGSSRMVSGVKTMKGGDMNLDTLALYNLQIKEAFDGSGTLVSLENKFGSIIRHNDTRKITGKKVFTNGLHTRTLYTSHLDDVPVIDLVTTSGHQTIAGATFSTLVVNNIAVQEGSTVDGLHFSRDVISLSGRAVLGHSTFSKGLTVKDNVNVIKTESGMDLDRLFNKTLKISGGTLLGSVYFLREVTVGSLKAKEMMGINVDEFMSETVFKNSFASITGLLAVPSLVTKTALTVNGNINGASFPSHFPLRTDSTHSFGAKSFSSLQFGSVTLNDGATVDGLDVSQLVTLNSQQQITGKKTFMKGVNIKGNLDISTAIIDGVNLNLLTRGISLSELTNWKFNLEFKKPVHISSLHCRGKVNGIDFANIAEDIIYTDASSAVISGRKKFAYPLTISDSAFENSFNNEKFDDLVNLSGNNTFGGNLAFKNDVHFDSLTVTGNVDGVDLANLASAAVYLDKEGQVVQGKLVFTKRTSAAGLEASGKINDVDFLKVLRKTGMQNFSAVQVLKSATFDYVRTYAIEMSEGATVNTIDLSELAKNRIKLNSADSFNGTLNIEGRVTILGALSAVYMNGFDIQQLKDNIVTDKVSCTVSGNVIFSTLNVDQSVTTTGKVGANGLNINIINANAARLYSDNFLSGSIAWSNLVLLGNVTVGGLVNGADLRRIAADAVYKNIPTVQIITGRKTFHDGFTVKGDIYAETTNGLDLATRLFTLHTNQVITGIYHFASIRAEQYVNLVGLYCNVNLKRLMANTLQRGNYILNGDLFFTNVVNISHLRLEDSLNLRNVNELLRDAIRKLDIPLTVTGIKTFKSSMAESFTTFKNIKVWYLNSVNFDHYLAHVVRRNSPSFALKSLSVAGSISAPTISATTLMIEGTIEGVDYHLLLKNAVHLTGDQTIVSPLVFLEDLSVDGNIKIKTLNNLKLDTDYLTTTTNQTIPYQTTLKNATTSDIFVGGQVNAWFFYQEVMETMKAVGGQTLPGLITFGGTVEVLGRVRVTEKTGASIRVKLSQQAVSLGDNSQIEGVLIFNGPLTVERLETSGIINGVNLSDLYNNAWFVDQDADFTARIMFNASVIMKEGLVVAGVVDNLMVKDLYKETTEVLSHYSNTTEDLREEYEGVCGPITALHEQLQTSVYEGDYFSILRELQIPHNRHSSTSFQAFNTTCVVMTWEGGLCDSVLYMFDPLSLDLVQATTISNSGYAHQWLFLDVFDDESVLLAMAGSAKGNNCTRSNSIIWRINKLTVQVHQELIAGERVSKALVAGEVMLYIHTEVDTFTYRLDSTTGYFTQLEVLHGHVGVTATAESDNQAVMFWASRYSGKVMVDGVFGEELEFPARIMDALVIYQAGKFFIVLAVHKEMCIEAQMNLELYTVDLGTKTVAGVDTHRLSAQANLLSFFTGSYASGSTIVMAIQQSAFPLVYKLRGEKLNVFNVDCIPRVLWAQYMSTPGQKFPQLLDHYVLLGRKDQTLLTKLIMRGSVLPSRKLYCDADAFCDPFLTPQIHMDSP